MIDYLYFFNAVILDIMIILTVLNFLLMIISDVKKYQA